jgi:capsular polysaccharide export protein
LPQITASFRRRARDSYWHYHNVVTGRLRYRHYRSHRSGSIIMEGLRLAVEIPRRQAQAPRRRSRDLGALAGKPTFVLPLQLSGDYQIRTHSSFPDMQSAAAYAIGSFAAHAPADAHLLLKAHPLDCSFFSWPRFVARQARRHGLEGRLHFVDGGDLDEMVQDARGLVCVNSTSATLALANGTPVCTLGEAIYDIAGLTHQRISIPSGPIRRRPSPGLYSAFRRVLVDRCMVRGGLASESAVATWSRISPTGCAARRRFTASRARRRPARSDRPSPARDRSRAGQAAPSRGRCHLGHSRRSRPATRGRRAGR